MLDRCRMSQPGAGAAEFSGNLRMRSRKTAHVHLVDDGVLPSHARPLAVCGGKRFDGDCTRHRGGAVGAAARTIRSTRTLQRTVGKGAVKRARVGIDQQFGGIEDMPLRRLPRAMHAQPVAHTAADVCNKPVKDIAGALRQADPLDLGDTGIAEQTEIHGGSMRRGDGEVRAAVDQRQAQRLRRAGINAPHQGRPFVALSACRTTWLASL